MNTGKGKMAILLSNIEKLVFRSFFPGILLLIFQTNRLEAATVLYSKDGIYELKLSKSESQSIDVGYRVDLRPISQDALFDGKILKLKGNIAQVKIIDGPPTMAPGTALTLKSLVKKSWYTRSMLDRSSSVKTTLWGGAMATSQGILGGEFGLSWVAGYWFDLDASGFVGTNTVGFSSTTSQAFIYGGGARVKWFPFERFYMSLGGIYQKAEEDNPKPPKVAEGETPREMPTFHDESAILAETGIGARLDSVSNLQIGKGFTVLLEFGLHIPITKLDDNITDISLLGPDQVLQGDMSLYGKAAVGYFF